MRDAFGALHWTPEVFWRSTLTEFFRAIEGFNRANRSEEDAESNDAPSDDALAALVARYG